MTVKRGGERGASICIGAFLGRKAEGAPGIGRGQDGESFRTQLSREIKTSMK